MDYVIEYYGKFIDGEHYLICKNTGFRIRYSDCLSLVSRYEYELSFSIVPSHSYSLMFVNEDEYNEYLTYCVLVN